MTSVLQEGAAEHMKDGNFVFWRDDTHWNALGAEIGAKAVAPKLKSLEATQ